VQAQIPPERRPDVLLEQQRKAEEEKKKREEITQPKAPPEIDKPARPRAPRGEGARVKVTEFRLSGHTVFKTAELLKVVAPAIGKELTVRELAEVADKIAEYYAGKGYILAQAYLPPQQIRGGVIEVAILEGNIGKINITGNEKYKTHTIERYLEPVTVAKVIHEGTLETVLNELNDLPGLRTRADLKPGEKRGLTDLNLRVRERLPHTLLMEVDNYGSRLTGPWRYGAELGIGNTIHGVGDDLRMKVSKSDDNLFFSNIDYVIPYKHFGTKLKLSWIHSENVIGEEFASIRPVGRADILSAELLQTITRTGSLSLTVFAGFDYKTVRSIFSNPPFNTTPITKDELRIFRLGFRGDYRDRFLGRNYFGLTWHYGVDFWGASRQNGLQTSFQLVSGGVTQGAGPGTWSKGTLDFARYQSLGLPFIQKVPVVAKVLNDSYLVIRAVGQISSDRLLSPERFTIGGYYTVRGYPIAERIGDHGYAATAEMVVPVPSSANIPFTSRTWKETFQVAAFIDHAGVYVSRFTQPTGVTGPQPQDYLTGAGGGLRISLPFGVPQPVDRGVLSLKIDWATAIGRPRPSSRDQGISLNDVYGDGAAGVLYVSASLRF